MSSKSSTTDAGDSDNILVGLIHKPHGLRGEVTVEVLSDNTGRFAPGSELSLAVPGVPERMVRVRSSRAHGRGLVVGFESVEDRDAAELLRGGRLGVERADVPPAAADEFYHFELIGCRCRDGGRDLGVVRAVIEDGGGAILEIADGEELLLVPFVKAFLTSIDPAAGTIELDLPDGLVDTCRSRS